MPRDLLAGQTSSSAPNQARDLLSAGQGTKGAEELAVQSALKSALDFVNQREPGIDYATGIKNMTFRAGFSRMSSPDEQANYLDKTVGENNWGKDSFGAYFIKPEGLKSLGMKSRVPVAIDEQRVTPYDVADVASAVPPILGAMGGAAMATGMGFPAGIGLTALGAGFGKALDEIYKNAQGLQKQGPGAVAADIAKEGASAGLGEGAFRLGAGLLGGYSPFVSAERKDLVNEALSMGARPKTYQSLERAGPLLQRFQATGERVLGDPAEKMNRQALLTKMQELQQRAGPTGTLSGEELINAARATAEQSAGRAEYFNMRARSMLNDSLLDINKSLGSSDPNIGATVISKIRDARRQFGDLAAEKYAAVDATAGEPIIPTAILKQQAEAVSRNLPRTKDGKIVFSSGQPGPIEDILNLPDMITVQQMQRIRTALRNDSEVTNLVPSAAKRDFALLKDAADQSFEHAAQTNGNRSLVDSLRQADAFYKEGIKKFDAPAIAAITKDASQTGKIEPDQVINYIIKPGYTAAAQRVKELVGPQVWKGVQRAHFDDLLARSRNAADPEGTVSGSKLYANIQKMGRTLYAVYGDQAPAITRYARELAAHDGKIPIDMLSGSDIALTDALKSAATAQKISDDFMKGNYLAALSKPGAEADTAVDFIFRPDSPQRIARARSFLGETSPEWQHVQGRMMEKLLGSLVQPTDDPLVSIMSGKALRDTLDKYGRTTLNAAFGPELTNDLYKFSNVAQLLTKKGPVGAGGIVAASVALHPISRFRTIADLFLMGRFLRTPGAIRWLTMGIKADTPAKARAAALAHVTAIASSVAAGEDKTGSAMFNVTAPEVPQQ